MRTPPTLLAITPGRLAGRRVHARESLLREVAAAIEGGVRGVLVREPHLEDGPLLDLALRVGERLRRAHGDAGWLGVHDRAHLAGAAGAHGVQLGGRSLDPGDARASVPAHVALGRSTHTHDAPVRALAGCAFALHAPVFPPTSKDVDPGRVLGVRAAADFAARARVPVLALGGVTLERLDDLAREGARAFAGAALIGGLFGPDPRDVAAIERRARALVERAEEVFA